jgi:spore maturation protein CgeD
MNSPAASIFLPSYNKPDYVLQAMDTVFNQTSDDWDLWLLENRDDGKTDKLVEAYLEEKADYRVNYIRFNLTSEFRQQKYVTSWLLNQYYPQAEGRYIVFLADDDLLDPECVEVVCGTMDENSWDAAWFSLRIVQVGGPSLGPFPDGPASGCFARGPGIAAERLLGVGGSTLIDCRVDSGQVVHRTDALDKLEAPYFHEPKDGSSNHVDGMFLQRLGGVVSIHPIGRYLATGRITPISYWTRS